MSTTTSTRASLLTLSAGLVVGSTLTLLTVWLVQKKESKKFSPGNAENANGGINRPLPLELRQEQLSRHELFFGKDGMARLAGAKVCIVGVGGVGSHCAVMLARSGLGCLRIIDFDQVSLSSLNRHACAVLEDVGISKVTCLETFCRKICPDPTFLKIDSINAMYTAESGPALLSDGPWDFVIDAIDDVPTKTELLAHCLERKIPVISCMGAGAKADPTRLHLCDLRSANKDPLAGKVRQVLKRKLKGGDQSYLDDIKQLTLLYSSEKPVVALADLTQEQLDKGVENFGAVSGMRVRIVPVMGTMPAIMGQALASRALTELGNVPVHPVPGERVGKNMRHRVWQHLKRREELITRKVLADAGIEEQPVGSSAIETGSMVNGTWVGPPQFDLDDVEYLMEVWRNRCAATQLRLGHTLELVRWDMTRPSDCTNLVLMNEQAMKQFDKDGKHAFDTSVQRLIEERLATCRLY